jgi:Tfp pilus assembly protein PilE
MRAAGTNDENGFTLIEVISAVAITMILLVGVGFAVTESLTSGTSSRHTVDRSVVGDLAARYFGADVASSTALPTVPGSTPSCGTTVPTAIAMTVDASTTVWYYVSGAGPSTLFRRSCTGSTLFAQQSLGTTGDALVATASCPVGGNACTLALTWAAPGQPQSYTLRGVRRATG